MSKVVKEIVSNPFTGEVSVEYSDDSTNKFNVADTVTAVTNEVTGGIELIGPTGRNAGITSISIRSEFDDIVGAVAPSVEYVFGSSAAADAPYKIALPTLSAIEAAFEPFEDGTQQQTINGELQTYVDFSSDTHEMLTDRLNLRAHLPGGDWDVQVTEGVAAGFKLDGTANTIDKVGLANTTGLRIGQLVAVQYKGIYFINAIVPNTSVSLTTIGGSPTSMQYKFLLGWLPIDSAVLTVAAVDGATVLSFGAGNVPAAVQAGMSVYLGYSSAMMSRNGDWRVESVDAGAGTVTLSGPISGWGTLSVGQRVIFSPRIEAGQIWAKSKIDFGNPDKFLALELDCTVMSGSRDYPTRNINTAALFAASPADVPWGAWPAWWAFSADDDSGSSSYSNSDSELDFMEFFWNTNNGPTYFLGANKGLGATKTTFMRGSGWTAASGFNVAPAALAGDHKYQFIFKNGRTYRYIDGVLVKVDLFDWSSQRLAQIGLNLAVGSISAANAAGFLFPMSEASLGAQVFGIKSMKIWDF